MITFFKDTVKNTPIKKISILILGWVIMLFLNFFLTNNGYFTGVRITFPMSVVYFSEFHLEGILFSCLFLILGLVGFFNYYKLSDLGLVIFYFGLITLGNLSQGTLHNSFLRPFLDTDFQYYHDAISIKDGLDFLKNFNNTQETLTMHAKTHPPFVVWFHFIIWEWFKSPLILSFIFSFLSMCAVFPLIRILEMLCVPKINKNLIVLTFACLPAINIYSIVSIDGIFLTFSLIFLLGIIRLIKEKSITYKNILPIILGMTLTNALSFSGTFFWAFFFFISFYYILKHKEYFLLKAFIISIISFGTIMLTWYFFIDYNHIKAFFTASHSENPNGFMGFHQPLVYFFTRLEDISEILLFSSFSFFALMLSINFWKTIVSKELSGVIFIALFTLLLMFATGAYGTGETARACMYIYPYLTLTLIYKKEKVVQNIFLIALLQTFAMQLIGDYFW
ncbi:hypothetical protein PG357_00310 [Riemerella anatipestifer]|nr:hypothetical protein [Riemerella anatipestifer]